MDITMAAAPWREQRQTKVCTGIGPYQGEWDRTTALHLLRRTTFGPTLDMVAQATELGLEATIAELLTDRPLPDPPVNLGAEDPYVPVGASWVEAIYTQDLSNKGYRNRSLAAWTIDNLFREGISVREKMVLFWQNHFGISNENDPRFHYRFSTLLRGHAWGNFRELVKDVTVDPLMLRFLNGTQNTKRAPNENYARELLELYTIGKGPQAGPGDYTNYTEEDIFQIARILTGWRSFGFNSSNPAIVIESRFIPERHDVEDKQLSHRFDHAVITNADEVEYATLIDLIFTKDEVARHICRKLYRHFVYYEITEAEEAAVIQPLADILIANDYQIKPVLETLFRSEHFYDVANLGPMIRHPYDYVLTMFKVLDFQVTVSENAPLEAIYEAYFRLFGLMNLMEMNPYNLPEVAGWKAYYQEPQYYRSWINANTLQRRTLLANLMGNNGFAVQGNRFQLDYLSFIGRLEDPADPNRLIEQLVELLMPQPLTDSQMAGLKDVLIPGLPDFEWTVEYGDWLGDPDNEMKRDAVYDRLRNLFRVLFNMAEFHLS